VSEEALREVRWLILIFRLPARQPSARVEVWRRLRRLGALPLAGSGYVLPPGGEAMEQLQWLAASVRKHGGEAAVIEASTLGPRADRETTERFLAASTARYRVLLGEAQGARRLRDPEKRRRALSALRRKLADAVTLDFFGSPLRARVERELDRAEDDMVRRGSSPAASRVPGQYRGRTWVTRLRPKIDRCGSAWLIRKFIDPQAKFAFAMRPEEFPRAVPFDMFDAPAGFGHHGDDCTFETLVREFGIRDPRVRILAQTVHDADIGDEKFGQGEAAGLAQAFNALAQTALSDRELLRRGMELFEGLYRATAGDPRSRRRRKRA
jgi:hypothetical protein